MSDKNSKDFEKIVWPENKIEPEDELIRYGDCEMLVKDAIEKYEKSIITQLANLEETYQMSNASKDFRDVYIRDESSHDLFVLKLSKMNKEIDLNDSLDLTFGNLLKYFNIIRRKEWKTIIDKSVTKSLDEKFVCDTIGVSRDQVEWAHEFSNIIMRTPNEKGKFKP